MKNPLLVQELREMLDAEHFEDIRAFAESNPPQVIAGFLEPLKIEEIAEIILVIPSETGASILYCLEREVRRQVSRLIETDDLIELVFNMSEKEQEEFIKSLEAKRREVVDRGVDILDEEDEKRKLRMEALGKLKFLHDNEGEILENVSVYTTTKRGLTKIGFIARRCWIDLCDPEPEEIDYLASQLNIPVDFFTSSLDVDERARVEKEDDATLIIVRVPTFDDENPGLKYATVSMGIILVGEIVITVSSERVAALDQIISGKAKNLSVLDRERFILNIIMRSTLQYLLYLQQINNITTVIQKKIQESSKNNQLIKMLNLEKSLVYFTTSLKSNEYMIMRLKRSRIFSPEEDIIDLLDDIEIENRQAIEMANIYSNILSGMMGAFASIISNNLNIVMKFLTSITIILTIPVLVASLYGMNVRLPLQDNPNAFIILLVFSLVISTLMIYLFRRKRWF